MKSLVALILAVAFLTFTGNLLAEEKAYVPTDNEELYGTWVNMDYGGARAQKTVYHPDGTWGYASSAKNDPVALDPYEITEKWTDSEGNIWYKAWIVDSWKGKVYTLLKISNSGNTLEAVTNSDEYPEKFDKEKYRYGIRYRQ